jgi:hypothetical protein
VPAPEIFDAPMPDLAPSEPNDATLPTEDVEPLPPTAIEPAIGPMGAVTRLRIAEKNVVTQKPPPSNLDLVNEDMERAREVNQHAARASGPRSRGRARWAAC